MDSIYTHAFPLKKLRTRIESGIFAVPEIQREFVWSARKACDLLDSLYWNYPIGTFSSGKPLVETRDNFGSTSISSHTTTRATVRFGSSLTVSSAYPSSGISYADKRNPYETPTVNRSTLAISTSIPTRPMASAFFFIGTGSRAG